MFQPLLAESYIVQNDKLIRPSAIVVANSKEKSLPRNDGNQLLGKKRKQYPTNSREVEVVDLEEKVELEGLAVAHQLSAAEDNNVVCDERDCACLEGRKRCLALYESEILGFVASDGLEDSLKDGPELKAKRAVERRRAVLDPVGFAHCARLRCGRGGLVGERSEGSAINMQRLRLCSGPR